MITVQKEDSVFTCYDDDSIIKGIQDCGAFSRTELAMISRFLRPGDTVLDIGAHIGAFSVPIKRIIGEQGRLFAFEANPQTYALLQKNLADNRVTATVFNKGVSDQPGMLYLRAKNLAVRAQNGHRDHPLKTGADYLTAQKPDQADETIEVELIKIDDVVTVPVNFIKVDVEGMEINVLRSAREVIDRDRPIVYSEYFDYYLKRAGSNPQEFADFFKDRNYDFFINVGTRKAANDEFTMVRIPGPQYIRGQVDFLMIPRESPRYPRQFLDWKLHQPHRFLWARVRHALSGARAGLRPVLSFAKKIIYGALGYLARMPRLAPAFKNMCQYYIRVYDGYSYDFYQNGEYQIIRQLFGALPAAPRILFDVGANKGDWSKIAAATDPSATIHAFEPTPDTFQMLDQSLAAYPKITRNNLALSNVRTHLSFNNYGHGSGRNSFVQNPSFPHGPVHKVEEVQAIMGKDYIEQHQITHIDYLKIDVEGWEYFVLTGFGDYLRPDFIDVIQFEYGYAQGDTKSLMKDFYALLEGRGYKVGKLRRAGVQFGPFAYHMNNFESGPNFVACHPARVATLSAFDRRIA